MNIERGLNVLKIIQDHDKVEIIGARSSFVS